MFRVDHVDPGKNRRVSVGVTAVGEVVPGISGIDPTDVIRYETSGDRNGS